MFIKISRHIVVVMLCLIVPTITMAETNQTNNDSDLATATIFGSIGAGYPGSVGVLTGLRIRSNSGRVPLGFEVSVYLPWGIGANLILDIYRNDYLRVNVFNLGIFRFFLDEFRFIRPEVERDYELTMGFGFEWLITRSLAIVFDCRWFFPDPVRIIGHYGDFARNIYRESAKGVQIWVGIGWVF